MRNIPAWEAIVSMMIAAMTSVLTGIQNGEIPTIIYLGACIQALVSLKASFSRPPNETEDPTPPTLQQIIQAINDDPALYTGVISTINAAAKNRHTP